MVNRLTWADAAKGLGIILVVLTHVLVGSHDAGFAVSERWYQAIYDVLFTIHMPLFFFMSGLFFLPSVEKLPWLRFVQSKLGKVLYPYCLWASIQGCVMAFLSAYTNKAHGWQFLANLPTGRIGHFWFLHSLFIVLVLSAAVFKILPVKRALFFLFFLSIGLYGFSYLQGGALNEARIPQYLVYFVLGVAAAYALKTSQWANKTLSSVTAVHPIVLLLALVFSEVWLATLNPSYPDFFHPLALATSLAAIAAFAAIGVWLERFPSVSRPLAYLGKYSLSIYLLHVMCVAGTRIILVKFFGVTSVPAHIALQLIAGVAVPLCVYNAAQKFGWGFLFECPTFDHSPGRKYAKPLSES